MDTYWLYIGIGGPLVAALLLVAASQAHMRRLRERIAEQDALLHSLERDMQAVCLGAKGMGDAVLGLEQKLGKLMARQDSLDRREPDSQLYHHAISLVRRGANVQDLVESCGLAPSEAQLVHLLHRGRNHAA